LVKIAIIGAGAAGCFAAANIPAGHEVIIFEKGSKPMQKVKVSGGGRCNVTHACFDIPELIRRYPRGQSLLKRSLYQFGPQQTIDWFQSRGVAIKEEADGRMFPATDDSQTIIDCIWSTMMKAGVQVRFSKAVRNVMRVVHGWELHVDDGSIYACDALILSPGSLQKPEQWAWLTALGHTIQPPAPSLFTFNLPGNAITQLMGVVVTDVTVKLAGTKFAQQGPLLITHWGFSGPAVLRTSAWAARALQERKYECTILVNWLKDATEADLRESVQRLRQTQGKALLWNKNPFELPRRLWEFLLQRITSLVADAYEMKGKTTFKEEFVTCGGVTISEINPQTMASRIVPGLFFAGEAIDVDGITGGYNFQHAWASGWIAATNVGRRS
jgi:predicted Rossmann fold flavoprotein